jgi:VanZ family protein
MRARMRPLLRFLWHWLPVLLWTAMILSAANDRFSDEQTAGWLDRLFGDSPPIVNFTIRKSAHVVVYAVLALLAWRARRSFGIATLIVVGVAMTDEAMQAATIMRGGSPFDVLLDSCGGLFGLLCVPTVRTQLRKPKVSSSPRP